MSTEPQGKKKKLGPLARVLSIALTYVGVPPAVARRVAKPLIRVLVLMLLLPVLILMVLLAAIASDDDDAAEASRTQDQGGAIAANPEAESPIPLPLLSAYRFAAEDSMVPWTLLAAIGELSSGSGGGYPASTYGNMLLAPSSGAVAPYSGELRVLEHAGHPGGIPEALFDMRPNPGDIVVVAPLPTPDRTTPDMMVSSMRRAALSVPGSVTLLWVTVDQPDWQTREVVVSCPTPDDDGGERPPTGGSPLLPSPFSPSPDSSPGGGGDWWNRNTSFEPQQPLAAAISLEGCVTRTENFLASDKNLFEDINSKIFETARALPQNFHALDFESDRTSSSMRPGPDGTFDDPDALDPARARELRLQLAQAAVTRLAAQRTVVPDGPCPRVQAPQGSSGVGVFGLNESFLVEADLLPAAVSRPRLENVCFASSLMVSILEGAAEEVAASRDSDLISITLDVLYDARGDYEKKTYIDEFWTEVLTQIAPAFGQGDALCLGLFTAAEPTSPAQAIADAFRCIVTELAPVQWNVLEARADAPLQTFTLTREESARRTVSDALEISWRHSELEPCNLFPITDAQFRRFRPPVERGRCDPLAEAYAAASLFVASARGEGEGWFKSVESWSEFEGVLGDADARSSFNEAGPWRVRYFPEECRSHASAELASAAISLSSKLKSGDVTGLVNVEVRRRLAAESTAVAESLERSGACSDLVYGAEDALLLVSYLPALADFGEDTGYVGGELSGVEIPASGVSDGQSESAGGIFRALADAARSVALDTVADSEGAPLLARASRFPLPDGDPYSSSITGSLPANSFSSRAMTLVYSQIPGLFSEMAWEMSGYGAVGPDVPFSREMNLYSQGVDPRLLLAMARNSGPMDPSYRCPQADSPGGDWWNRNVVYQDRPDGYGLFGLRDASTGCASPEVQVSAAASEIKVLASLAGGSWQGAAYAWGAADREAVAEAWVSALWDITAFASQAGVPLESLGPADGRSVLAMWYESQMLNVGVAGDPGEAAVSLGIPVYDLGDYDGVFLPPTPTTIVRSCPGGCFGHRPIHPRTGKPAFHHGVDFSHPTGTPIRSVADGVVTAVTFLGGFGNMVIVSHGAGTESVYAHLNAFATAVGLEVSAGDVIGYVGSTGYVIIDGRKVPSSTGPHLHFEIRLSGERVDPCRPTDSGIYIPCTLAYR